MTSESSANPEQSNEVTSPKILVVPYGGRTFRFGRFNWMNTAQASAQAEFFEQYAASEAGWANERDELVKTIAELSKKISDQNAEHENGYTEPPRVARVTNMPVFRAQVASFTTNKEKLYLAFETLAQTLIDTSTNNPSPELKAARQDLLAEIDMSRIALDSVDTETLISAPQDVDGLYLSISVNNAATSTERALEDVVETQDDEAAKSRIRTLGTTISRLFKKVSSTLWHIVSGLLTPKEWTLKGAFSGAILGFGPKAEIEIKFGR